MDERELSRCRDRARIDETRRCVPTSAPVAQLLAVKRLRINSFRFLPSLR